LNENKNDLPSTKKLSSTHLSKMPTKISSVKKINKINDNSTDSIVASINNTRPVTLGIATNAASSVAPSIATNATSSIGSSVAPSIASSVGSSDTLNVSSNSIINQSLSKSIQRTASESTLKPGSILNESLINVPKSTTTTQNNSLSNTTTNKVVPGQSLTPTSHPSGDEQFADLTYAAVQVNLRILGDLKEGEKIMITDNKIYMQVDDRYMQSIRRHCSADSRIRTLKFIAHVIDSAKNYCNDAVQKIHCDEQKQINLQMLINIQSLLGNALTGLSRLATTYGNDKLNLAMIDTYKSTITVFCDQDLKRAISNDYNSD
jgi:hypothetical protein